MTRQGIPARRLSTSWEGQGLHRRSSNWKRRKSFNTTKIQHKKCKALIDTGASRSCISEKNYNEMHLPPLSELFALKVTSANGSPIKVLGVTKCPVTLGNEQYTHTFIVCRNIKRPMILGIDFLRKYRIVTNWTEKGEFQIQTPSSIIFRTLTIRSWYRTSTRKITSTQRNGRTRLCKGGKNILGICGILQKMYSKILRHSQTSHRID